MAKTDNVKIEQISRNALGCIEKVAEKAEDDLQSHRRAGASTLTTAHTFNNHAPINNLSSISDSQKQALNKLLEQPVVARVEYLDDDGKCEVIFITRGMPISLPGFKIASYNSSLGRLATIPAGETYINNEDEFIVDSSTKLFPKNGSSGWDSPNTEIYIKADGKNAGGKFTVLSLRQFLAPQRPAYEDDPFGALPGDENKQLVIDGFRRAVLSHISLRDRPILDQHQDEIFRLPINVCCFLSGPPGTGKTTTLIRRLGQKTAIGDSGALDEGEQFLIRQVEDDSKAKPHRESWIMFSPTELLRQYVKEAFAREGLPATDHHIRTWSQYRREVARDHLQLLRTTDGRGPFIELPNDDHVDIASTTATPGDWYDDFITYLYKWLHSEISTDIKEIKNSNNNDIKALAGKLEVLILTRESHLRDIDWPKVADLRKDIGGLFDKNRQNITEVIDDTVRRVIKNEPDFLLDFADIIRNEPTENPDADNDDYDDDDAEFEDEEAGNVPTRTVSGKQARACYEKAVIAHARTKLRRSSVSGKSLNGRILTWLGENRIPDQAQLQTLAKISDEQRRLRRFTSLDRYFLKSIPRLYKKFRKERTEQGKWYRAAPVKTVNISQFELDIVILATLRMAGQLIAKYRDAPGVAVPESGILGNVRELYRSQILVDEATDFSIIQLACMYELAHPLMKSFFICGDINQRLTDWGVRSSDQLDWIAPNIQRRYITVAYRQSEKLIALAKDVALLGGSSIQEIELPDRVENVGVSPVWEAGLGDDAKAANWLADRICEIERMVGKVPTIGVLVNEEGRVEPLANVLNARLQEVSLSAVACKDGKVVGNDRDIRVFNIEHIKGLEFEAVFFVDLDHTIEKYPELYTKYLYVGATRAANYLAVTFASNIREEVRSLSTHFRSTWSL